MPWRKLRRLPVLAKKICVSRSCPAFFVYWFGLQESSFSADPKHFCDTCRGQVVQYHKLLGLIVTGQFNMSVKTARLSKTFYRYRWVTVLLLRSAVCSDPQK